MEPKVIIICAIAYLIIGVGGLALLNTVLTSVFSTGTKPGIMSYIQTGSLWPIYLCIYVIHSIFG